MTDIKSTHFECTQCGLCCKGIGDIVKMHGQISRYGFYVRNEVVHEMASALITPEYRDIFENDHSVQEKYPSACFFLRRRNDGKYVCTIHPYRLFICKDYHCCTARIYKDGNEIGRVKGNISLVSNDDKLKNIWREFVQSKADPSREYITAELQTNGFSILYYEG